MEQEFDYYLRKNGKGNEPKKLNNVLNKLEKIAKKVKASVADIIILAGNVALEKSIKGLV